jgi:hypothetical protein
MCLRSKINKAIQYYEMQILMFYGERDYSPSSKNFSHTCIYYFVWFEYFISMKRLSWTPEFHATETVTATQSASKCNSRKRAKEAYFLQWQCIV